MVVMLIEIIAFGNDEVDDIDDFFRLFMHPIPSNNFLLSVDVVATLWLIFDNALPRRVKTTPRGTR